MVAIAIAGRAKRMSWKSPLQQTLPKLATAYGYRPQKSQAKTRESMSTMLIDSARCCAGDAFGTEFTDRRETGRWVARNASGLVSQWLGFFFGATVLGGPEDSHCTLDSKAVRRPCTKCAKYGICGLRGK